jgi:hypothetical protein
MRNTECFSTAAQSDNVPEHILRTSEEQHTDIQSYRWNCARSAGRYKLGPPGPGSTVRQRLIKNMIVKQKQTERDMTAGHRVRSQPASPHAYTVFHRESEVNKAVVMMTIAQRLTAAS